MDTQQISALSIVVVTAVVLLRYAWRRRGRSNCGDCQCSVKRP